MLSITISENQQCGNKKMLTVDIYNNLTFVADVVAVSIMDSELPAIDEYIVRINEGT